MHSRFRVVSDRNSDHKLLEMFADSFARMSAKERANAPEVVTKD